MIVWAFRSIGLTESGEKIGRKLFALLTKTQQKELERFISESKNSESDSVLSPCYPCLLWSVFHSKAIGSANDGDSGGRFVFLLGATPLLLSEVK